MKNRLLSMMLCAAGMAAPFADAAPADAMYAPENTDLVVRVDGGKIRRSKLFGMLRTRGEFKAFEARAQRELAGFAVSFDEVLDTDLHLFANTRALTFDPWRLDAIVRNGKPLACPLLARADAQFADGRSKRMTLRKTAVGGREARLLTGRDFSLALIAIDENALQVSINLRDYPLLVPRKPGAGVPAIAPEAMIGAAYRMRPDVGNALKDLLPEMLYPLVKRLKAATVGIFDAGDGIRLESEFVYVDPKRAMKAAGQLRALLTLAAISISENDPDMAELIMNTRIAPKGEKVTVSASFKNGDVIRLGAMLLQGKKGSILDPNVVPSERRK